MNGSLYCQLYHAIDNNPNLDPLSLYFLGICTKYAPTPVNLDSIIKQLPLSFSNLYDIFLANGKEIGFLARNLVRVVYHILLEDGVTDLSRKPDMDLSVIEENTRVWFRDFELLKLLYPEISKAQWFLLGSVKANDPSCDTLKLVRQIYIELLVQKARLDEAGQVALLSSHMKANIDENLVPPMVTGVEPEIRGSMRSSRVSLRRSRNFNPRPFDRKFIHDRTSKVVGSSQEQVRGLRRFRLNLRRSRRQSNVRQSRGKADSPIRIIDHFDQENIDPKALLRSSLRKSFGGSFNEDDAPKILIRESLEELNAQLNTLRKIRDDEHVIVSRVFEKRNFEHDSDKKPQMTSFEKYLEEHRANRKIEPFQSISILTKPIEIKKTFPECLVCLETLEPESTINITECKHSFHNGCLKQYLETKIDERKFPITCPMNGCSVGVPESDLLKLLDKDLQDKFYNYSLRHFAETHRDSVFFCMTPDCEYFTFIDESTRSFYCVTCQKAFCVKCKREWHDDMPCEESKVANESDENDKMFGEYVQSTGCKQCPRCNYYVHKVDGCNHMTCRCKHEFCYGCGQNMDACYCEN